MPNPATPNSTPAHHTSDGRFHVTWDRPSLERGGGMLRWMWDRFRHPPKPNPPSAAFPRAEPKVVRPAAPADELHITWVGHASFLVQIGGLNVLTDPMWGERASPFAWIGPRRVTEPGISFDALPPIDAVVISHDHYDHLDESTIRRLVAAFGERVTWITPLRYRSWLKERGADRVVELDWWQQVTVEAGAENAAVTFTCSPCQHWTRRRTKARTRLWSAWTLRAGPTGPAVYFGGDSGYFPGYPEVAERTGPFDAVLLPIGAYEPRWFMRTSHMNPEEAVQAYQDLGGDGLFVGMHWATFRLTDEPMLEPPQRTRAAWEAVGLQPERLWIPAVGETRTVVGTRRPAQL